MHYEQITQFLTFSDNRFHKTIFVERVLLAREIKQIKSGSGLFKQTVLRTAETVNSSVTISQSCESYKGMKTANCGGRG